MLKLQNISFSVTTDEGVKKILKDISLDVERDSYVVITGPNGSGKSTLAKLIMGIEKPTEGRILFNGEDITSMSITERAQKGIGFAFQQPVRFKGLTVKDLIEIAAGKDMSTSAACAYLSEVGLCARDYIGRELDSSFSGGELKRIEIATLIARETVLSLFDEPEAGIDLWSFHSLISVFERMRERTKSAVMIISHQERILSIADKILILDNGQISEYGDREDILPELLSGVGACSFFKPPTHELT